MSKPISVEQFSEIWRQFQLQKHTLRFEGRNDEAAALLVATITADTMKASDPVVEANREALKQRSEFGLKKYGVPLGNGDKTLSEDQATRHALEEALDLANYLQTLLLRREMNRTLAESLNFIMDKYDVASDEWGALDQVQSALRGQP